MTALSATTLKTYFTTGAKPTATQFGDVMDSYLNLATSTAQTVKSAVTVSGAATLKNKLSVDGSAAVTGDLSVTGAVVVSGNSTFCGSVTLPATGVSAGTYGTTSAIPVITVGADGLISSSSEANYQSSVIFSSHKNGSNQTSISTGVATKITFTTADINTGAYYSTTSSKFMPPSGMYSITAQLNFSAGMVDQTSAYVVLYKNSAALYYGQGKCSGTGQVFAAVNAIVSASGTDEFEVYALGEGAGDKTVYGGVGYTFFQGRKL